MTALRRFVACPSSQSRQRGVVLFIALIVMVAMSLAAIALIRSVDTTSAVIANLAFRQASLLPANYAVEAAAASLFADASPTNTPLIADLTQDDATQNYFSTYPPVAPPGGCASWDDQYGVPCPLQKQATALALARKLVDVNTGNTITYLTERMCNPNAPVIPADKSPGPTWCDMMQPKQSTGETIGDPNAQPLTKQPFYRVTVRVDGPKNSASFLQVVLR
jgi:type IV pilus assembly protein PilX